MNTQNYSNHVRWYPLAHFVVAPLLILNIAYQGVRLYQEPSWDRGMLLVLGVTLLLMNVAARLQALKAQDRVIRLEENLRFARLLSGDRVGPASALPMSQIIALRFASDQELPALLDRVQSGELKTSKEIKMAIREWRGDYLRV